MLRLPRFYRCFQTRNAEQAEQAIFRTCDFLNCITALTDQRSHIRLPAAQPDLANQHVFNEDPIAPPNFEAPRAARAQLPQLYKPFAVAGDGRDCLPLKADADALSVVRFSPDRRSGALLQDYSFAKERR
jgi:hypothetical protein